MPGGSPTTATTNDTIWPRLSSSVRGRGTWDDGDDDVRRGDEPSTDRSPLIVPQSDRRHHSSAGDEESDTVPWCGCDGALLLFWKLTTAPAGWLSWTASSPRAVSPPTTPCHEDGRDRCSSTFLRSPPPPPVATVDHVGSPHYKAFHPGDGYEALSPPPSCRRDPRESSFPSQIEGDAAHKTLQVSDHPGLPTPPCVVRGPIYTVLELQQRIESIKDWLPITIKIEGTAVPAVSSTRQPNGIRGRVTERDGNVVPSFLSRTGVATTSSTSFDASTLTTSLCVSLCGPIRRPVERLGTWRRRLKGICSEWEPPSLSDVEDLLLEDAIGMTITGVLVVDMDLQRCAFGASLSSTPLCEGGPDGYTNSLRNVTNRSPGAPILDGWHRGESTLEGEGAGGDDEEEEEEDPYEVVVARVLGALQNIMGHMTDTQRAGSDASHRSAGWQGGLGLRLHLVRCVVSPSDLLDALRLPDYLESLVFHQCPLADAHISALIRRARQSEIFFDRMRCLKLSGNLSIDAVRLVLRYLDEEVEHPVLSEMVVPPSCQTAAAGHSITIRLPSLLINGTNATRSNASS